MLCDEKMCNVTLCKNKKAYYLSSDMEFLSFRIKHVCVILDIFQFQYSQSNWKKKQCEYHSRLAELDQVLVCGPRMEAADIQVSFTQLFPPDAVAATVGTGGRHLVAGRHIGLLQQERNRFSGLCINTQTRTYFVFLNTSKLWTSKAMFVIISCVKNSKKRLEMMRDRGWSCMRGIILWKMISYSPHVNTH